MISVTSVADHEIACLILCVCGHIIYEVLDEFHNCIQPKQDELWFSFQ